jgi:ech hydrogenase subunit D
MELLYHFDKDLKDRHLRMKIAKGASVPSISPVYFAAFLIENEIEDQFGVKFDGLVLDFGGTLYLEEEVMRTPFCKYGVTRTDGAAGGEAKAASAESA